MSRLDPHLHVPEAAGPARAAWIAERPRHPSTGTAVKHGQGVTKKHGLQ